MSRRINSQYNLVKQTFAELNYDAYLNHCRWMERAIALAQMAGDDGEIPIAALMVDSNNNLIAQATNQKEKKQDATAHAEILAIRTASQVKQNYYLNDCTLYATLEPCPMCAGAIIQARIGLLVYGADEPKTGAIRTVMNLPDSYCSHHRLKVLAGIKSEPCRKQLQAWFQTKRNQAKVSGQ